MNKEIERLKILEDAMIANYLTELDFNNEEQRVLAYDSLLYKTLVEGTFDDIFLSDSLEGLENTERQRIIDLSRKYNSLCFYNGDFDYWLNSCEGVSNGGIMAAEILLDNYDYLIRLAKNGGERVLKFINKFQDSELFDDGAVIALLRSKFYNDDVLENVLIEMSKEDGDYKDFTDNQKIVLCNYPEGILYKVNEDNTLDMADIKKLRMTLQKKYIGSLDYDVRDIDLESFIEMIDRVFVDNNENIYGGHKK